jgi:hypothetical protein
LVDIISVDIILVDIILVNIILVNIILVNIILVDIMMVDNISVGIMTVDNISVDMLGVDETTWNRLSYRSKQNIPETEDLNHYENGSFCFILSMPLHLQLQDLTGLCRMADCTYMTIWRERKKYILMGRLYLSYICFNEVSFEACLRVDFKNCSMKTGSVFWNMR